MKIQLAILAFASGVSLSHFSPAQERPPATPEAVAKPEVTDQREPPPATFGFYAMFMPFVEYIDINNPTPPGTPEAPDHMVGPMYTGVDGKPRIRMTSGTSHFGFRASLALAQQLRIIGQLETALAVDGNPNPWAADIPNRDTYAGFTGDWWGSIVFGLLDTPYKWSTLTTVNPIKAGYVADFTPILHTPGFTATAINSTQGRQSNQQANGAFFRREGNSIQYWSPRVLSELAGVTVRLNYTANEGRLSGQEGLSVSDNPYILSAVAAFEMWGLRLRYAFELHRDFFGLGATGLPTGPNFDTTESTDTGHVGLVQYTLSITPDIKTRIVGVGELLSYKDTTTIVNQVDEYSRPAYYALLHQQFFAHHVWGAYGQAFPGTCHRFGGASCSTGGLGAALIEAGYMYAFNDRVNVHVIGYHLANDRAANYVTAPTLPRTSLATGADTTGVGFGLYYAFDANHLD